MALSKMVSALLIAMCIALVSSTVPGIGGGGGGGISFGGYSGGVGGGGGFGGGGGGYGFGGYCKFRPTCIPKKRI